MAADGTCPPRRWVIDAFAGAGGASTGLARALGRDVDVAVNHSPAALAIHKANHKGAIHLPQDVFQVKWADYIGAGDDVDWIWASPDCKHFSRAKGGRPVNKKIRGLGWSLVRYVDQLMPRGFSGENVEEYLDWGPLHAKGTLDADGNDIGETPIDGRRGQTFHQWVRRFEEMGYLVDWRVLNAADYGAPTTRKRLYFIGRRDGLPQWPTPTHASPKVLGAAQRDLFAPKSLKPWRTAAEIIDWSIPCPSIFERAEPLEEKTLQRIAHGMHKFVFNNPDPFVVPSVDGVGAPIIIPRGWGERAGQSPRAMSIQRPLSTVVGDGEKHGLAVAFVAKNFGGHYSPGSSLRSPLGTVTATDHNALVTAFLAILRNNCDALDVRSPLPVICASGEHIAEVRAFLVKYYGNEVGGQDLRKPLGTVTTVDRFGLVTVAGSDYVVVDIGFRMLSPRELARAQGFDDDYVIAPDFEGKPLPRYLQIRGIGNSVCPPVAAAIYAANAQPRL